MADATASDVISKLVSIIEDAAKTSLSTATTAKLNTVAAIVGELGDVIADSLSSKYPNLPAILTAIEAVEEDADKLESDIVALIAAFKTTSTATATTTTAA